MHSLAGYTLVESSGPNRDWNYRRVRGWPLGSRLVSVFSAVSLTLIGLITLPPSNSTAQELSAVEIATKAYERYEGNDVILDMLMTLISKDGKQREREITLWRKETVEGKKMRMLFNAPADLKGTGFLVYSYTQPDKEEDQWLFLPSIKRTRRIAGKARSQSFMGTDFSFDDLGERKVSDDTFTLLREESHEGYPCYVLEATPKAADYQYGKRLAWITKDHFIVIKGELYDRSGNLEKVLAGSEIRQTNDIWTAHIMKMTNVKTNHATILELKNVRYNTNFPDDVMAKTRLEEQ